MKKGPGRHRSRGEMRGMNTREIRKEERKEKKIYKSGQVRGNVRREMIEREKDKRRENTVSDTAKNYNINKRHFLYYIRARYKKTHAAI